MPASALLPAGYDALPLTLVVKDAEIGDGRVAAWAAANGFTGATGQVLAAPDAEGRIAQVLFGAGDGFDPVTARQWASRLPGGDYRIDGLTPGDARLTALFFLLGTYRFDRYKAAPDKAPVRLVSPDAVDAAEI